MPSPYILPEGEMITQIFYFTKDFLNERNTGCIFDRRKSFVEQKIKRGLVSLVKYAGWE